MCALWSCRSTYKVSLNYPILEIRLAREEFQRRWSSAIQRDDDARYVNDIHRHDPPNVIMKNCIDYPFEHDNNIYQMPSNAVKPTCSTDPKLEPESVHPKMRFTNACMRMTENCLSLDDDDNSNNDLSQSSNHSIFYVCDHCPFRADNSEEALNHLKSKKHISCSEYLNSRSNYRAGDDTGDQTSELQVSVLRTPRNVYNAEGSMPGWSFGDSAVYCPTCFLLLPDKLLCAYHHYSQHPGHIPKFAYGKVLDSREFVVSINRTKCLQCKQRFRDRELLLLHWFGVRATCRSPLNPVEPQSDTDPPIPQIVDVYCDLCRVHFDRIPPTTVPTSKPAQIESKPNQNRDSNSVKRWAEGFCKFCLNHVQTHADQFPKAGHFGCRLRIRIVRLDRSTSQNLTAYVYQNDSALILRFLRECKLLVSYLKLCHGGRRSLMKQAKIELTRLIRQSRLCVT